MRMAVPKPYWTERELKELMKLWREGRSNRQIAEVMEKRTKLAIVSKLSRLGMIRSTSSNNRETTNRPCLSCGRDFPSTSRFNRICRDCKKNFGYDTGGKSMPLGKPWRPED